MSADNWTICPKCQAKHFDAVTAKAKELDDKYGKVTKAEYKQLESDFAALNTGSPEETLREDYEIGVFAGEFSVSYSGYCRTCDLHVQYKYSFEVPIT